MDNVRAPLALPEIDTISSSAIDLSGKNETESSRPQNPLSVLDNYLDSSLEEGISVK